MNSILSTLIEYIKIPLKFINLQSFLFWYLSICQSINKTQTTSLNDYKMILLKIEIPCDKYFCVVKYM